MPRNQRRGRRALSSYLAGRQHQHSRAWAITPVSFLDRLGFDVSHFVSHLVSHRRAKPIAAWWPGEFWKLDEGLAQLESESQLLTDAVADSSFQTNISEPLPETGVSEIPLSSAPDETTSLEVLEASGRAAENDAAVRFEDSMPISMPALMPVALANQSLSSSVAKPAVIQRRSRIEEIHAAKPVVAAQESAASDEAPKAGGEVANFDQIDPARLFEPTKDRDMSPAAWARRLAAVIAQEQQPKTGAGGTAPKLQSTTSSASVTVNPKESVSAMPGGENDLVIPIAPTVSPGEMSSEQLPESTQRFLRPLIGFDATGIKVVRGAAARQITGELQADAATIGRTVILGTDYRDQSPEQFGVLAHELTHVARQLQPRFVPPIARDVQRGRTASASSVESMGEESLALRVEGRVIRAAVEASTPAAFSFGESPPVDRTEIATPKESGGQRNQKMIGNTTAAQSEHLPDWVTSSVSALKTVQAAQHAISQNAISQNTGASLPATQAASFQTAVQLAERGRTVEQEISPPQNAQATNGQSRVAPDLDALARQVYSIIKRRLTNEHRREFFT